MKTKIPNKRTLTPYKQTNKTKKRIKNTWKKKKCKADGTTT